MVPDKFNMVDMGGIDLIMMQGEAVPGLYDKLMAAISNCRYQCLYNWMFDGVLISPTYVQLEDIDGEVFLNEGVSVTSDDVIRIYSLEPGPVGPEIIPLLAEENGVYNVPSGKDGFNPVTVDVSSYTPVIDPITITENGIYNAPIGVDGYSPVTVNVNGGGPSLPAEYQEVEYIDFTGAQFFSVPADFTITAKPVVYTKSALTNDSGSSEMCIIGNGDAGSSSGTRPEIYYSGKKIYVNQASVGSLYVTRNSSGYLDAGYTYSVMIPVGVMAETLTEYGTSIPVTVLNVGKYSNGHPFMFTGRLYRVWFGDDTGVATGSYFALDYITRLFDLVPCYRKSDTVIGFYDVVNSVFYTNQGSGAFVKGPDIN